MVWKYSDLISIARWTGNKTDFFTFLDVDGDRDEMAGPIGIPFKGPKVFLVFGVSSSDLDCSPLSSSAHSKTSANIPLSRVHLTSRALLVSTSTLYLSTFERNQFSIWSRPALTSS